MKIYDITYGLSSNMIIYPGDAKFKKKIFSSIKKGQSTNTSVLTIGSHNGTHFDAPYHIFSSKKTLDKIAPSYFIGKALVVEIKNKKEIALDDVEKIKFKKIDKILFKTSNSFYLQKNKPFNKNFVHFTKESARFLAQQNIKLIGIDYLSVDKFHSGNHPAHTEFMKKNILLLETINLYKVKPGVYDFFGAPLLIQDADGAPARVFLIQKNNSK